MPIVIIAILVLAPIAYLLWSRSNELFCISVRNGECLVLRGKAPVRLRQQLFEIVERAGLEKATIRGVKDAGHARLLASGVDEWTLQRLRNAFGVHPISAYRQAPVNADGCQRRNVGQVLGWAWLAWLLVPRR